MPCKQHKQALIDAASSGEPLPGILREHLNGCVDCQNAFTNEQALFAAIDNGVRHRANAEMPASFLPAVRSSLAQGVPANGHRWVLALAAALLVIVAGVVSMTRLREANTTGQAAKVKPSSSSPTQSVLYEPNSVSTQPRRPKRNGHRALQPVHLDEVRTAEVLVPSEEREAFQRFVAERREDEPIILAFVSGASAEPFALQKDDAIHVAPLEVKRLEVRPLDPQTEDAKEQGNSR